MKRAQIKKASAGLGGFTLVEIMIVVAILGLLIAIAIPNYVKARANSQANACINNLRQIDGAMQQYAIENQKKVGDPVNYPNDLTPYIKLNSGNQIPQCPANGNYSVSAVGIDPSVLCSLGTTVSPPHTY
jgi:prepilin-type N-terminal cleavage/methylation domain-containing protein